MKVISIYSNGTAISDKTVKILEAKLRSEGYIVEKELKDDSELLICVGGDGVLLGAVHKYDFPSLPIIGINTGHLGFFQEIEANMLDDFIYNYKNQNYSNQPLSTVEALITLSSGEEILHRALNEVIVRSESYHTAHLSLSIDGSFIERFSGDGLLIATSAGSTAYNYSLGGSIVDPRLNLLQVTPMCPMNTKAYRSFTSSILLPSDLGVDIVSDDDRNKKTVLIVDGITYEYEDIKNIKVLVSKDKYINLLRYHTYDFWNKVKSKFL